MNILQSPYLMLIYLYFALFIWRLEEQSIWVSGMGKNSKLHIKLVLLLYEWAGIAQKQSYATIGLLLQGDNWGHYKNSKEALDWLHRHMPCAKWTVIRYGGCQQSDSSPEETVRLGRDVNLAHLNNGP